MSEPKYIVGIDLGTTNITVNSVAVASLEEEKPAVTAFPILQEFAKGAVEEREVLPSFLFQRLQEKPALPWTREAPFIVGEYARERGAEVPARLVSSAKSWLCHPRIDRRAPLLPWNAPPEVQKISPLDAQAEYLAHLRLAWNAKFPKARLENQMVIITIPASFDAVARDLTVEAARLAGLPEVILLEEPQAAFYSWIGQTRVPWREQVKKGDVVLVVDVGGGTTDFSLIEISEQDGDLALERVAVGNHILLGGDNMDLALAFHVKGKLEAAKKKIDTWQTVALSHACRRAKELLFTDPARKSETIVVSGRGSSVIGGAVKSSLERQEIEDLLVDGFFPPCAFTDSPREDPALGFREVNLAYAADAAITRHLAAFLRAQAGKPEYQYPKAILFNGGVFQAKRFQDRLVEVVNSWLQEAGREPLNVLEGADLVRAVSAGAVQYGMARQGKGIRIRGGISQNYYLGIESSLPAVPGLKPPLKALCLARMGTEEGTVTEVPRHVFGLVVGKRVEFKFFKSNARRDDQVGQLFDEIPPDVEETSSLTSELPPQEGMAPGTVVDVTLQVAITEIGTLEIWCRQQGGDHRWKLEFNVRDAIR
ncbi:MAG: Chaperone protein DnaK [Candidatus Ozemobacter sibiricus]|uniref:Chaperone protein DnaK n=1 Tax=Candidatus Ozemobacter sibiricus TaxID=2268124 RepID=A0A367ZL67_9BACT|nr:MAG: Chaperone protein DnaK [Candidatus Ozemobacter sibiricus]